MKDLLIRSNKKRTSQTSNTNDTNDLRGQNVQAFGKTIKAIQDKMESGKKPPPDNKEGFSPNVQKPAKSRPGTNTGGKRPLVTNNKFDHLKQELNMIEQINDGEIVQQHNILPNRLPRLISGGGFNYQIRSTEPPRRISEPPVTQKPKGNSVKNLFSAGNHIRIKKTKNFVEKQQLGICGDRLSISSGWKSGVGGVRSKKNSSISKTQDNDFPKITEQQSVLLLLLQQGLNEGMLTQDDYLEKVSQLVTITDANIEALFEDNDDLSEIEDDEVDSYSDDDEEMFEKDIDMSLQDQAKNIKMQMPILNKDNLKEMQSIKKSETKIKEIKKPVKTIKKSKTEKKEKVKKQITSAVESPAKKKGKAKKIKKEEEIKQQGINIIILKNDEIKEDEDEEDEDAKESKKNKKKQGLGIYLIQPINIEEQEILFFENDCQVDPQFEYKNNELAKKFINLFKQPRDGLITIAYKILESVANEYGDVHHFHELDGNVLSQEVVEQKFVRYLKDMDFPETVYIRYCANQVAGTSVSYDRATQSSRINIRQPVEYRDKTIPQILNHELGTHFLRRCNDKVQVWFGKRKKYEMKPCIQTEEGLASTNALIELALEGGTKRPFLWKAALNYYMAYKAQDMSFMELFNDIAKYVQDPKKRFRFVCRIKRGMQDTKESGGLYKDQVYLEGAVKLLKLRNEIDFRLLHCGKISLDDYQRPYIQKQVNNPRKIKMEKCFMPYFIRDYDRYMKALDIIAKTNFVFDDDDLDLPENEVKFKKEEKKED